MEKMEDSKVRRGCGSSSFLRATFHEAEVAGIRRIKMLLRVF